MATISDVARAAGVSRSTVSYALSGKRSITRETQDRIQNAIRELGFTPTASARALKTNRTMLIGLSVPVPEDEFVPFPVEDLLRIAHVGRPVGYDSLLLADIDGAAALHRIISSRMVDGVLLLDVVGRDPRVEQIRESNLPAVLVGSPQDAEGLDMFGFDYRGAARLLVDNLHGLGHREILLVGPPPHVSGRGTASSKQFRDAALGHASQCGMHIFAHPGEPGVATQLHALLDGQPQATALIVCNEASLTSLPLVLRERNIDVPRDLSIVSFHSRNLGQYLALPYTAIETSYDEIGQHAMLHLLERINHLDDTNLPVARFVLPRITDRGSTVQVARR